MYSIQYLLDEISNVFFLPSYISSHIPMSLDGVEIIVNGSGSYTEIRKGYVCRDLVMSATARSGGCYLFANLRGCDGKIII